MKQLTEQISALSHTTSKMSAASPPGSAPKSMSSRLLTMKFMQRAANSSPSVSSPSTPEQPSLKRRRTDSEASPSRANIDSLADRAAVQAALANEEAKRQLALEKQAAEAGDTRWVLSFEDQKHSTVAPGLTLRVVQTGFATLDTSPSQTRHMDDDIEDVPVMVGRRSFGRFNKILEVCFMEMIRDLQCADRYRNNKTPH